MEIGVRQGTERQCVIEGCGKPAKRYRDYCSFNHYNRDSYQKRPKKWVYVRLKQRCKIKGIEFSLKMADIPDAPEFCPVFPWIKLERATGKGRGFKPNAPTIDRIDPTKGYEKGNIRIISWWANTMRSNGGIREFEALIADAKRLGRE
jgi:hypothetical protein